jgi:hypothetical protein
MRLSQLPSFLLLVVAPVIVIQAQNNFTCDVYQDDCPTRSNGICESETNPSCAGKDCADCNYQCTQFNYDCGGCINNGCFFCPGGTQQNDQKPQSDGLLNAQLKKWIEMSLRTEPHTSCFDCSHGINIFTDAKCYNSPYYSYANIFTHCAKSSDFVTDSCEAPGQDNFFRYRQEILTLFCFECWTFFSLTTFCFPYIM